MKVEAATSRLKPEICQKIIIKKKKKKGLTFFAGNLRISVIEKTKSHFQPLNQEE